MANKQANKKSIRDRGLAEIKASKRRIKEERGDKERERE